MANAIYESKQSLGTFAGSVLAQTSDGIGGYKKVFVNLSGPAPSPQYPLYGGILVNPFKGHGKIYAGDLVEYTTDGKCKLLKTYEIGKATKESTDTDIYISSGANANGSVFRHIPFVGDFLMKAPNTLTGKGTAVTVTAVEKTFDAKGKQDGWKVTISAALGSLAKGDVLVEASAGTGSVQAMVTNPNCYVEVDYDCPATPATGDDDFEGARYLFTPNIMMGNRFAYIALMSPLPASVKSINTSRIEGWFKL